MYKMKNIKKFFEYYYFESGIQIHLGYSDEDTWISINGDIIEKNFDYDDVKDVIKDLIERHTITDKILKDSINRISFNYVDLFDKVKEDEIYLDSKTTSDFMEELDETLKEINDIVNTPTQEKFNFFKKNKNKESVKNSWQTCPVCDLQLKEHTTKVDKGKLVHFSCTGCSYVSAKKLYT